MKFIVCVTFVFLCTPGFSRSEAVDKSENKGKADGYKRMITSRVQKDPCKEDCYLKYFAGRMIPEDLEISNPSSMSCICQKDYSGIDYFATYFDKKAGIAAYSAYTITAADAKEIGKFKRPEGNPWKPKGETNDLYQGSSKYGIHKGHLNPSLINSYNKYYQIATFDYTNAVPQFLASNLRDWKTFEGKIANYVKNVCRVSEGKMHLITGTSRYLLDTKSNNHVTGATTEKFPPGNPNGIERPNSLWTAGCCVNEAKAFSQSIAVWGNNNIVDAQARSLSLTELEKLLVDNLKPPANLFPAFSGCRTNDYSGLDKLNSIVIYP